ncbi:MAG: hypothetical protein GXP33_04360 [Spirochaetes bacterium]|nr:hypothetical protein [Spirochaetota bacterium]
MEHEYFRKRSYYIQLIRDFFIKKDYIEVDTPVLSPFVIPESGIEVFKTSYINPVNFEQKELYLLPSPEILMKKLLASEPGNIFQIAKSFRNGEQTGSLHNPEFTMLEWYTMDFNYIDSISVIQEFLRYLLTESGRSLNVEYGNTLIDFKAPFIKMTMHDAFKDFAEIDLNTLLDPDSGEKVITKILTEKNLNFTENSEYSTWEVKFNTLFLSLVEPKLPKNRPVILMDYPSGIPTLAKTAENPLYSERWELYISGFEIANCYTEETDYQAVERFILRETEQKKYAAVPVQSDYLFSEIFKNNFPECSGVALGIERVLMILLNCKSIRGVIPFLFF